MEPSLSVDVECTMTADFFTQMRVAMNMQRMVVNQMILKQNATTKIEVANDSFYPPNQWPTPLPSHTTAADHARRAALRHHERS